jgi:hypothetical protein
MEIVGGLSTVSVDGTTITGNGTPGNPLVGVDQNPPGWPLTFWALDSTQAITTYLFAQAANGLALWGFSLPAQIKFNKLCLYIAAADAVGLYDVGLYSAAGVCVAHIGPQTLPTLGPLAFAVVGGPITLPAGRYYFATAGNGNTATYIATVSGSAGWSFYFNNAFGASVAGALPATITPPADSLSSAFQPYMALSI